MERFLHNANVELYRRLLAESKSDASRDEDRQSLLLRLLATRKHDIDEALHARYAELVCLREYVHRLESTRHDTAERRAIVRRYASVTMCVQKDSPEAEKEVNWLPAPEGGFVLSLRTYLPAEDIVNGSPREGQ